VKSADFSHFFLDTFKKSKQRHTWSKKKYSTKGCSFSSLHLYQQSGELVFFKDYFKLYNLTIKLIARIYLWGMMLRVLMHLMLQLLVISAETCKISTFSEDNRTLLKAIIFKLLMHVIFLTTMFGCRISSENTWYKTSKTDYAKAGSSSTTKAGRLTGVLRTWWKAQT